MNPTTPVEAIARDANLRRVRVPGELVSGQALAERRERIATAALQGLLAATPSTTQATSNAEQYGTRAVRYADALIEALNRGTAQAMTHARSR